MIYEHLLERVGDSRVRAGLIGAGAYGTSLLAQAQSIDRLEVAIVCDQDVEAAQRACQQAGVSVDAIAVCDSRKAVLGAIESGKCVIAYGNRQPAQDRCFRRNDAHGRHDRDPPGITPLGLAARARSSFPG